jgi:hypothetical protein
MKSDPKQIVYSMDNEALSPFIFMEFGDKTFFQLTVKMAPLVSRLIPQIIEEFDVEEGEVMQGMAFDRDASMEQDKLVPHNKIGTLGVYVLFDKAKKVEVLFEK